MSSIFKITFDDETLADITADPLLTGVIEKIGGESVVQTAQGYGLDNLLKYPRGNVGGQFVFTSICSYASFGASAGALAAAYALLNVQDDCVLTYGAATLTFADAILKGVERVKWDGVMLQIRYTFEITTIASS